MCIATLVDDEDRAFADEFDARISQTDPIKAAIDRAAADYMSTSAAKIALLDEVVAELYDMQRMGVRSSEFTAIEKKLMSRYEDLQR